MNRHLLWMLEYNYQQATLLFYQLLVDQQCYSPDKLYSDGQIIDNTSTGPVKGGIRFAETVTPTEIFRLASTMTRKCAAVSRYAWKHV